NNFLGGINMSMKYVIEMYELMDSPKVTGENVKEFLLQISNKGKISVQTIEGEEGSTDFIKVVIPGKKGKCTGGDAPTLGIIGRLGGIGARPEMTGFVSDGDGALASMSIAAKLLDMLDKGDQLDGDVIATT